MVVRSNLRFGEATALVIDGLNEGLQNAAKAEQKNIEENFDAGRDALGAPWQPLSPVTIEKKGHGQILKERGDLRSGFYTESDGVLSVELGNSDPKAGIHESGTETIPSRKMLAPARVHLEQGLAQKEAVEAIRKRIALMKFRSMF